MTSPSSNCKDDLDNFLVNLTQNQKASGIVITPDIDNEPKQIVNLVKTCNMNDFVHLENAIAYVSGYILKRLYETVLSFNFVNIVGLFEIGFQTHFKSLMNKIDIEIKCCRGYMLQK